jgi:hypothetical protein
VSLTPLSLSTTCTHTHTKPQTHANVHNTIYNPYAGVNYSHNEKYLTQSNFNKAMLPSKRNVNKVNLKMLMV